MIWENPANSLTLAAASFVLESKGVGVSFPKAVEGHIDGVDCEGVLGSGHIFSHTSRADYHPPGASHLLSS